MPGEGHLHQSPAILRNDVQFEPVVGKLLRAPTLVIRGLDAARRTRLAWLTFSLRGSTVHIQQPKEQSNCVAPHHSLFLDPRCHDTCPVNHQSSYSWGNRSQPVVLRCIHVFTERNESQSNEII